MKCPDCGKDVKWFYDHVCEIHGWGMERAEHYADAASTRSDSKRTEE